MATIGVIHVPLSGHVRPLARLGRLLARRGHRVVAWCGEDFRDVIERDGVQLRAIPSTRRGNPTRDLVELAAWLASWAVAATPSTVEAMHAEDVDLVVFDSMAPWGRVAAAWLGLPAISSSGGSWPLLPPTSSVPAGTPGDPRPELLAWIEESRLAIGRTWGVELGSVADTLNSPGDLNLGYTTPEILGADPADPAWRLVGPLLDLPDGVHDPALDGLDGRPLVFFSLGTVFTERVPLFRMVLEALADEPVQVLAGTSGRVPRDVLGTLPGNVVLTDRLGVQRAILERAELFVSHCGAGSMHESLAAGVPLVAIPQYGDQLVWADRVAALGAGAVADETHAAMRTAVRELLGDGTARRRARALAHHLAGYDGESIAVGAVEELLA